MKDATERNSLIYFLSQKPDDIKKDIELMANDINDRLQDPNAGGDKALDAIELWLKQTYPLPKNIGLNQLVHMKELSQKICDTDFGTGSVALYLTMVMGIINNELAEKIQQKDLVASQEFDQYLLVHRSINSTPSLLSIAPNTAQYFTQALKNNTSINEDIEKNLLLASKSVNILDDTNRWLTDYNSYLNTTLGCRYHAEKQAIIEQFQTILSDKKDNNLIKLHKLGEALAKPETARILQTDSIGAAFSEVFFKIKQFFNPNSKKPEHMMLKTQLQDLKKNNIFIPETTKEETNNKESNQKRSPFDVF